MIAFPSILVRMEDWDEICAAISGATGRTFIPWEDAEVSGGDISRSFRLGNGTTDYFVKLNSPEQADMFAAEMEGLRELAASRTVRVPRPVCAGVAGSYSYLVLEYLRLGAASERRMAVLGTRLAAMHRVTRGQFGWYLDNTIGTTSQPNPPEKQWLTFWREYRLRHQLDIARGGNFSALLIEKAERLLAGLPALFEGYEPESSLLHGDLWSGNKGFTTTGEPVLFDPAVYFGDRETDIAMTELFGMFPESFYDAYNRAWPLDEGYAARREVYQLYHLLNHYNLFGDQYIERIAQILDDALASIELKGAA